MALPRFTISVDSSLTEILKKLGVNVAFTSQADFTRMVKNKSAQFDQMTQKIKLIVNERGTEASAFTHLSLTLGFDNRKPFDMVVNRPFIVIIRDDDSGAKLLMGIISKPERDTASSLVEQQELIKKVKELEIAHAKKPDADSLRDIQNTLTQARDFFFSRGDLKNAKKYSDKLIALAKDSTDLQRHLEIEMKLGNKASAVKTINQLIDQFLQEFSNPSSESRRIDAREYWERLLDNCDKHILTLHQNRSRILSAKELVLKELITDRAGWKEKHAGAWRRELTSIGIPNSSADINLKQFMSRYKRNLAVLAKDTRSMQALQKNKKAFLDWHPTFQCNNHDDLGTQQLKLARLYIETKKPEKAVALIELSILNSFEDKNSEPVVQNVVTLIKVLKTLGRSDEANNLSARLNYCKSTRNAYLLMYKKWDKVQKLDREQYAKERERQDREDLEWEIKHGR